MKNIYEQKDSNNPENQENSEENKDTISKLLEDEQYFISIIKKISDFEFDDLFPQILNLPKIDFLNQLTSNVSIVLSERFSKNILENEKCVSLITLTCHSFDKKYNKYLEELSSGWDKYNLEKMNLLESIDELDNKQDRSFFFVNFRKHCHKTQNTAIHQCDKNGEIGSFIIIYNNPINSNNDDNANNKPRIKYLICDNCRKSYFTSEFPNFCEYCNTTYLCSSLYKNENSNFLSATLNPPHCEPFVNEEIPCTKCKNILYIDIKNSLLKCGNINCNYCINLEKCKNNINFKCKTCKNYFYTNVKIYNPIEVFHFKDIIKKALLYKRKAFPGKLSCCNEIKEKKTDFYHKKDCKGNLYLAEYNQKMIIVCSKCKAVNQYSKFIWTCPECGIHFRDKKSEINEIKIRKTKSSKGINTLNTFQENENENFNTINNLFGYKRRASLADFIKKKQKKENKKLDKLDMDSFGYSTGYEFYNKNKIDNDDALSERKKENKDDNYNYYNENNEIKSSNKKIKKGYLFSKILPWGTPLKLNKDLGSSSKKNDNDSEDNKKYYDKKVEDLINPNEEKNLYLSGKAFFRRDLISEEPKKDEHDNKIDRKINEFKINDYYDLDKNLKEEKKLETMEVGSGFKRKKFGENKINQKEKKEISSDLKYKKQSPIKMKYLLENKNKNDNKEVNNYNKNNFMYISNHCNSNEKKEEINKKNSENITISTNNKESWQSKETTAKGSVESKNSLLSHSPSKDDLEKNNKNNSEDKNNKEVEEDIIPFELIDYDQCVLIEDKNIKDNEILYRQTQRRLKRIISRGRLPRFNLDNFTIEKQIGDGSFGVIYSIYNNKTKKKYAMKKIIANDLDSLELYQKEFEIAHKEKHNSILDIKGTYIKCFDNTTYVLYVLMDLAEKDWEMEINERKKQKRYYQEKEIISILKQLSNALFILQKKSIAHRDIKPENILLFKSQDNNIEYKICDFGEAKDYAYIRSKRQKTLRGTELYMSPLLYDGLVHDDPYVEHDAYKSDVFSLGCCMIIAMNLNFDIILEIRKIKEQERIKDFLKNKNNGRYCDKLFDIILKMINFNEKERIDFIQLENLIEKNF